MKELGRIPFVRVPAVAKYKQNTNTTANIFPVSCATIPCDPSGIGMLQRSEIDD